MKHIYKQFQVSRLIYFTKPSAESMSSGDEKKDAAADPKVVDVKVIGESIIDSVDPIKNESRFKGFMKKWHGEDRVSQATRMIDDDAAREELKGLIKKDQSNTKETKSEKKEGMWVIRDGKWVKRNKEERKNDRAERRKGGNKVQEGLDSKDNAFESRIKLLENAFRDSVNSSLENKDDPAAMLELLAKNMNSDFLLDHVNGMAAYYKDSYSKMTTPFKGAQVCMVEAGNYTYELSIDQSYAPKVIAYVTSSFGPGIAEIADEIDLNDARAIDVEVATGELDELMKDDQLGATASEAQKGDEGIDLSPFAKALEASFAKVFEELNDQDFDSYDQLIQEGGGLLDEVFNKFMEAASASGQLTLGEKMKAQRQLRAAKRGLRRLPILLNRAERKLDRLERRAVRVAQTKEKWDNWRETRKYNKEVSKETEELTQGMLKQLEAKIINKINTLTTEGFNEHEIYTKIHQELSEGDLVPDLNKIYDLRSKFYLVELKFVANGISYKLRAKKGTTNLSSQRNNKDFPDRYSASLDDDLLHI